MHYRALLLDRHPGTRRVRPAGAGGCRGRLHRRGPRRGRRRHARLPRGQPRVRCRSRRPSSRPGAGDRADRQHPAVPRSAPWPGAADSEARRLTRIQLQLTIADLVAEVHDSHHPIASRLYYDDQRAEARTHGAPRCVRIALPKYLDYFEQVLRARRWRHAAARAFVRRPVAVPADAGLDYAFPRAMQRLAPSCRCWRAGPRG